MKTIGKIVNSQGLKGEVRILSNSDFKDIRFAVGNKLVISYKSEKITVTVEKHFQKKNFDIIKFKEFNNINEIEKFKDSPLLGVEIEVTGEDGNYPYEILLGLSIYNQDNIKRGLVIEVKDYGYIDILIVERENKKYHLPYSDTFINRVDLENKKIFINEIEGLLDEN